MRKGRDWTREIVISPQFLAIQPHFVRKDCAGQVEIAILSQFLAIEPHFVRKGCAGQVEIAILSQFLAIEPHFVRKGCAGRLEIAILSQFLAIEPYFVRKRGTTWNRNFTCERVAFRAVSLTLQKRNRKEGEGKRRRCEDVRARGQEVRGEDVKKWGCEDVKMWGWEDVKMSRCEDEMWGWEDVKMRRCEDVRMRSHALGKKIAIISVVHCRVIKTPSQRTCEKLYYLAQSAIMQCPTGWEPVDCGP